MIASLSSIARQRGRAIALHHLLLQQSFYPLMLCTTLAISFLAARTYMAGSLQYRFLVWNLFLAWVPYGCSLIAIKLDRAAPADRSRDRSLKAIVWVTWLAMFPNAPYIITDFVHLWQIRPLNWWYDLGMMLTFALAGCFLGIVSLRIMHDLVRPRVGAVGGWLFVTIVAALSGFGIYLGRFARLNSWDLLARPHRVFAFVFPGIVDPLAHPRTLGVTLMFGAMTLMTYVMFVSMQRTPSR
jgi:uncharacterized membrane protein